MNEINYEKYSMQELQECLKSIDKDKFPDNYERLIEEINKRNKTTSTNVPDNKEFVPDFDNPFSSHNVKQQEQPKELSKEQSININISHTFFFSIRFLF